MIQKFRFNVEYHEWQRVDRVQEYKGVKIETLTVHADYNDPLAIRNKREYRVTYPNGKTTSFPINKRGGNITELKKYIDFKIKYQEI